MEGYLWKPPLQIGVCYILPLNIQWVFKNSNYKNCYHLHGQQSIEKRVTNYLASILYQMHKFVL